MTSGQTKKIIFSGGGSGGSVTPLLAVAEELRRAEEWSWNFVFVGTTGGPEREMVAAFNARATALNPLVVPLKFVTLSSGKFRRYFSWKNIFDVFKIIAAYFQAQRLLRTERPDLIVTAGGFVSVPLVWAAASRKIPILIHQQDVRPGLANQLMAPFARAITVTFEKSLGDYGPRAAWVGNPHQDFASLDGAVSGIRQKYNLSSDQPLVIILGGGTGSTAINNLIFSAVSELSKFCQIIHLTGRGKLPVSEIRNNNYQTFEFLDNSELVKLLALADLVVTRAGLAFLTELSSLAKPIIIIPMPDSHQEDNAAVFATARAAVVLGQVELTPAKLTVEIRRVLDDKNLQTELKNNIGKVIKRGAATAMAGIIEEIVK